MKKQIRGILIVVLCTLITGCAHNTTKIEQSEIDKFQNLMANDKIGDLQSVYWDGAQASLVDDELDNTEILDGDNGAYTLNTVETGSWSIEIPSNIEYKQGNLNKNHCKLIGDDWWLEINPYDYGESSSKLDKDSSISLLESEYNDWKQRILYRSILEKDSKYYAGYTLILKQENKTYKVDYYGIGNMRKLSSNALTILKSFKIKFK